MIPLLKKARAAKKEQQSRSAPAQEERQTRFGGTITARRATIKEGLTDNTLVIFASDTGGFNAYGAHNEPLRGRKGTTFESGIRVPAVVSWPGHFRPAALSIR